MTNTITAFAKTLTLTEATARLAELDAENAAWGESDDRVTEANAIRAKLAEAKAYADEQDAARWASKQIADARAELALMAIHGERNVPADHRIEFEDKGRRRTAYYTTRDGFLKALIRMYLAPARFDVIHVD